MAAGLSDTSIRHSKPTDKPYRLYDRDGLYVLIGKKTKTWYHKRMEAGRVLNVKLGNFPETDLADARRMASQIKSGNSEGLAILEHLTEQRQSKLTVCQLFDQWERMQAKSCTPAHIKATRNRFDVHVRESVIGPKKVVDLEYVDLKRLLQKIARKTHNGEAIMETAHRISVILSMMLRYAKVEEIITPEKALILTDLKGILAPPKRKPFAALTKDPSEFGACLKAIFESEKFHASIKCAAMVAPFVALRANELTQARWSEIDLSSATWIIPAERMKGKDGERTEHFVPLPAGVIKMLADLKALNLSDTWVFPQIAHSKIKNAPISTVAVGNVLIDLGYKGLQTMHGFRACFRTYASEYLEANREVTELQLHHDIGSFTPNGLSYNRVSLKEKRRKLMQDYENFLVGLIRKAK